MLRGLAVLLALLAPPAAAQNRDHPGLVHLGGGEWGTPEEARARGMLEHRGQWFDGSLEKDLRKWEKEDAKKGLAWEERYHTKSRYYRIETNVPRYRVELEIEPFLDELFETYKRVFEEDFGLAGKAAGNKDIRIYDGFHAYSENEREADGSPRPRTNPGFIVGGSVLVVYYDETDPGEFYSTVFHEGAHQFFLSLLPGATPPKWLGEALATYFEGCTFSRATGKVTPGFVSNERLEVAQALLKKNPQATAQELFLGVPDESFQGAEYALAWSFVHYLIHRPGEESHERFARFVQETNGSGARPAAEVFARATGERLEDLIPGWRDHVLALRAPDPIHWIVLSVSKARPAEDLRSKDWLWSLDGVEVYSLKQFRELWKNRPADRPYEVVVVRTEPDESRRFVRVTIDADSEIMLRPQGEIPRSAGLSD